MAAATKNLRTCRNGHSYYKSSSCPVCPICEQNRKPEQDFLATVSAPARRALEREGLTTLIKLSRQTEAEILQLHGMGPSTIPRLRKALQDEGLTFRQG